MVLAQAAAAVEEYEDTGLSILGLSHRTDTFEAIVAEASANVRALLAVPAEYEVLFLQGGGTLQFSMVPLHLARGRAVPPDYLRTGYWSRRAVAEAAAVVPPRVVWDGEASGYRRLPRPDETAYDPGAPYLHYVSNETVEGLQHRDVVGLDGVPRVCDLSSDFLARPFPVDRFALLYAHAQKNIGPAGVTVVILHRSVAEDGPRDVPALLQYRSHVSAGSIFHTPPVYAIYVVLLVTRWLLHEIGGLEAMAKVNAAKAARLYRTLDAFPDVFVPHAERASRSDMNVSFHLADPAAEPALVARAEAADLHGLAGHRSVGGLRASLYNGVSPASVERLCTFLEEFAGRG